MRKTRTPGMPIVRRRRGDGRARSSRGRVQLMKFFSKKRQRRRSTQNLRVRPTVEALETRIVPYTNTGTAWPNPQLITISFVPDGTVIGSNSSGPITSNLFATLDAKFGSAARWENVILSAAQAWAQETNINFSVVAETGTP